MVVIPEKVVIIGAGQLGSRHLQGLSRINIPVAIQVIDPNPESLKLARERYEEMPENTNVRSIEFSTSQDSAVGDVALVIIATNADIRARVIKELTRVSMVKHLVLEKVLFQKVKDYSEIDSLLTARGISAHVNCPRRIYPFYRELRRELSQERITAFTAEGSHWGMGCNAIHFLDLFAFLSSDPDCVIDSSALDNTILESKRPGFIEFTGAVGGVNSRGGRFTIASRAQEGQQLIITIVTDKQRITINESTGTAEFFNNMSGTSRMKQFSLPYQSQLTDRVAADILTTTECSLTPLKESAQLHLQLLQAFSDHLNAISPNRYDHCPIT